MQINVSSTHRYYNQKLYQKCFLVNLSILQSNLAISNSVNSKSPLFRRKIECPWIYPSPLRFPGYFEAPLFRTFFHFPWDFEIAGFDCTSLSLTTFFWHVYFWFITWFINSRFLDESPEEKCVTIITPERAWHFKWNRSNNSEINCCWMHAAN